MVMLSVLSRFGLYDSKGRRAVVTDFSIDLLADEHPPITSLRYRRNGHGDPEKSLPWEALEAVDWKGRRFLVDDLDA